MSFPANGPMSDYGTLYQMPITGVSVKPRLRGYASTLVRRKTYKGRRAADYRFVKSCMYKMSEKKHQTTTESGTLAATGAVGASLTSTGQGTSSGTRVGMQILVTEVAWVLQGSLAAAAQQDQVRAILLFDTDTNGTAAAVTDVLESAAFDALYNRDKVGKGMRFYVLDDYLTALQPPSATVAGGTGNVQYSHRGHKKFPKGLRVLYQSNANTVSDIVRGNLFWIFLDKNNGATTYQARTQICYIDV